MNNQAYYSTQSEITDPKEHQSLFDGFPDDVSELCKNVQGIMVHIHWADKYGVTVTKERQSEQSLRKVRRQLSIIERRAFNDVPIKLPLKRRIFGTCRDFSTLLCSILRHKNVPARPRCGFATYFDSESLIMYDHWICEYWDSDSRRWKMADAQLDDIQCEALGVDFDVTDIPRDKFLLAGKAWQLCRKEEAEPSQFGIKDWFGMWFIKGNVVRDLLSLSKTEVLPWDINETTGAYENHSIDKHSYPLLDFIAELTVNYNTHYTQIIDILKANATLNMSSEWKT